jgi:hypothetical protein
MKWLFFSYRLPPKPSKLRVYVWRQLKKIGAVNYQSVWVVPHMKNLLADLQSLASHIEANGGGSLLIEGKPLSAAEQERIANAFLEASTQEYLEIAHKCDDFLKEIAAEIARKNFIFAEVEENEEDLEKLRKWLEKIEKRHLIKNPLRKMAAQKLKLCEKALEDFSYRVYKHVQSTKKSTIDIGQESREEPHLSDKARILPSTENIQK